MQYGYGRVSTNTQDTALQEDAFKRARVRRIITEKWSSVGARPQLMTLIARLQPGDEVVVYKLDRMGRSLQDLLNLLDQIMSKGAAFRSLTEPIDTRTPAGKLMFSILGAVAEFERSIIRERSIAGQVAAIKRGVVVGGRPKKLNARQAARAKTMRASGATWYEIGDRLGVSHTTARRAVVGDHRDRKKVLRHYLH